MAIDNTGITSLDTGAGEITYSGNEGPKSPDQELMAQADPMVIEMYEQYVFEMEEQGIQPMPFRDFMQQIIAESRIESADGGTARLGFKWGGPGTGRDSAGYKSDHDSYTGPSQGPAGGASAGGDYGGNVNPNQTYGAGDTSPGLETDINRTKLAEENRIQKESKEKNKFMFPSFFTAGIEAAKQFRSWNNAMQRKNFKKWYESKNPHPMGFVWDDWTEEDWSGKSIDDIPGYREYLNRFETSGGDDGRPEWMRLGYPSYEAYAAAMQGSTGGSDTAPVDPVTGFPTGPIRFASSEPSVHDFTGIYGQREIPMAADGGRIGYAGGGITDLRQGYFLGKLVKKAGRALKKVAKSPIGRMGLMALGGWGLNQWKPGFFDKGIFAKDSFLAPLLRKNIGTKKTPAWGGFNPWKLGILGMSAYPLVAGMGKEEDEDFTDTDLYKSWLARKQGWDTQFAPVGDEANFQRMRLYSADGGRIGYAKGGNDDEEDHRSAALSAMYRPGAQEGGLMDMGGMEKDYRNEGGFVPIGGQERADDVPARLSKNEFVFTADAVRNAGGGDIDKGAEIMENLMENLEQGGKVSEESQGLEGARNMFATSQRLEGVL